MSSSSATTSSPPRDVLGRKLCANPACRAVLIRRPAEKAWNNLKRKTCGKECSNAYIRWLQTGELTLKEDGIIDVVAIKRVLDGFSHPLTPAEWVVVRHIQLNMTLYSKIPETARKLGFIVEESDAGTQVIS